MGKRDLKLRYVYAEKGLNAIPRMLGLMDRNKYSKTYGCMDRFYWVDKAIDFPSSIMQFGIHALALAYSTKMPDNIYYRNKKIFEWIKAGMNYWISIQKNDGSFDEFYPNERGWAGPTGFLLYAMCDSYKLLKKELSKDEEFEKRLFTAFESAALYLAKYDEYGVLANHHAMALLPIYYAYKITNNKKLLYNFKEKWKEFIGYQSSEGWFLEYDGADLGYLSASVSFMAKIYKITDEAWLKKDILSASEKAIKFSSYFAYPNKYYAGTIGSRQTLHFYPHGYEIFAGKIPFATAVAEHLLNGLNEGKLVPPEIMADRYFVYRVPEMLLSYADYNGNASTENLPFKEAPFSKFFENSGILIINTNKYYAVINASKGGVIKIFEKKNGTLIANDCGVIGKTKKLKTVSSQWISKNTIIQNSKGKIRINGNLYSVSTMSPTPFKFIILRVLLLTFGNNTALAYKIKGLIRNMIILKNKKMDDEFDRIVEYDNNYIRVRTKIIATNKFKNLSIGDEFSVRYVPQSLYFQKQELGITGREISERYINKLNANGFIEINSVNLKW